MIVTIALRSETSSEGQVIYQDIYYRDSDGDVYYVDFELIATTPERQEIRDREVRTPADQQKAGVVITGWYTCGSQVDTVTVQVTLMDRKGHHSFPQEYVLRCGVKEQDPVTLASDPRDPTLDLTALPVQPTIAMPPDPPIILIFDPAQGIVEGLTCAGCAVNLYSGKLRYSEGRVVAGQDGKFALYKGKAFSDPLLTAITTDTAGKTSLYSAPVFSLDREQQFQLNNINAASVLPAEPPLELLFNGMGNMQYIDRDEPLDAANFYWESVILKGFTFTRCSTDRYDWGEADTPEIYSIFRITPSQDKAIDLLNEHGIPIYFGIQFWDSEIKLHPGYSRFRKEEEVLRFLDYLRFIVDHFKGKIEWYSLFNEPNISEPDQRYIKVDDYISVVHRAVPVIREIDPQAKIVVGEVTALNTRGGYEYLMQIAQSDLIPLVDGIAWHVGGGLSLEYQSGYYQKYPIWIDDIVKTAREHGFRGQFFANEISFRTQNTNNPSRQYWVHSDTVSAKYLAQQIVFHLSKGFMTSTGWEGYQKIQPVVQIIHNLANIMAGAKPVELSIRLDSTVDNIISASFLLPNGDLLLALWTNGKAIDVDPGVKSTITIHGLRPHKLTGIDPLYSNQQELNAIIKDGDLVIENYLIKDYPLFIRLEGLPKEVN